MKWQLGLLHKSSLSPLCLREATSSMRRWHKADLKPLQQLPAQARSLLCSRSCPPPSHQDAFSLPVLTAFGLLLFGPGQLGSSSKYNTWRWERPLSSDDCNTSTEPTAGVRLSSGRNLGPGEVFCHGSPLGRVTAAVLAVPVPVCSLQGNERKELLVLTLLLRDGCFEDAWHKTVQRRQNPLL